MRALLIAALLLCTSWAHATAVEAGQVRGAAKKLLAPRMWSACSTDAA